MENIYYAKLLQEAKELDNSLVYKKVKTLKMKKKQIYEYVKHIGEIKKYFSKGWLICKLGEFREDAGVIIFYQDLGLLPLHVFSKNDTAGLKDIGDEVVDNHIRNNAKIEEVKKYIDRWVLVANPPRYKSRVVIKENGDKIVLTEKNESVTISEIVIQR